MTTTCPVTVHVPIPPEPHTRGAITYRSRRCGEPVVAEGLCERHLADKRRLS